MSDRPSLPLLPAERLLAHSDVAEKLLRTVDAVAGLAGADVLVLGEGSERLVGGLLALDARPTIVGMPPPASGEKALAAVPVIAGTPASMPLGDASADVILGAWTVYRGIDPVELAEADRVLRPAGRLVIVHDYGRDDLAALGDPGRPEVASWSRRGGPFLRAGFKIRVVHCRADFGSLEETAAALEEAFGAGGMVLAGTLRRPRVSYNLAVYHRVRSVA